MDILKNRRCSKINRRDTIRIITKELEQMAKLNYLTCSRDDLQYLFDKIDQKSKGMLT